MAVINISDLAEVSDYEVYIDGTRVDDVKAHRRSDGAWELVRRILEQEHG